MEEKRSGMAIEQALIQVVRALPPDKQQELLAHAERLRAESAAIPARRNFRKSGKGLWAGMGISISTEDIDEMRREMWEDFPRDAG